MRFLLLSSVGFASTALALPGMGAQLAKLNARQAQILPNILPLSADEGNSGPIPSLVFDAADQYVNVAPGSTNEFIAPTSTDERGPCPGLNAAANHGFLPRSGITTIEQSKLSLI